MSKERKPQDYSWMQQSLQAARASQIIREHLAIAWEAGWLAGCEMMRAGSGPEVWVNPYHEAATAPAPEIDSVPLF